MTSRRFVLLDRDGTINVEREYLSDPHGLELLPNAAVGMRHMRSLGLGLIVITNQSGIGRGYFDKTTLETIHERLRQLLGQEGVVLDGIYVCPHHPEWGCHCRKPQSALIEQATREHRFDATQAFVVGDKAIDVAMGRRVGATTILVRTGYGAETAAKSVRTWNYDAEDLADAAQIIEEELNVDTGR